MPKIIDTYPTMEEVEKADRIQLARWNRLLRIANDKEEVKIIERVYERFLSMGGMNSEISKEIGW